MEKILEWVVEYWFLSGAGGILVLLFLEDVFIQKGHAIRHNFPLVGRMRYFLEMIGPELRQYWVANDKEETPFNREERRWIYASAKGQNSNFGFGTTAHLYTTGYPLIKHAMFPFPDSEAKPAEGDPTGIPCLKVMGERHGRRRPFRPVSIVNISAMSFGSLGARAVESLSRGVAGAKAYHNSGEGGVSPYHKSGGGDIMWQLGTGYFGARDDDGRFCLDALAAEVSSCVNIRCIEIKLSQGAKPGKGGILPGAKVTPEIAEVRGIPVGKACISPNAHTEFHDVPGLIDFIERIADRTGLPVGIKSAIGEIEFWERLAAQMKASGKGPDFITVDGSEGGTGAAPLTFSDHVALPFKIGFARVYEVFQKEGITNDVVWIGSGKLGFPDRAVVALAMGCDVVAVAREAMMAIGCIQAQKCHTGECPTGVATQSPWLQRGLDVKDKATRTERYLKSFRKELISLAHASGYQHPSQFTGKDIDVSTGVNRFTPLSEILGYDKDVVPFTDMNDYRSIPAEPDK